MLALIALSLITVAVAALALTVFMYLVSGVPYVPTPKRIAEEMVKLSGLRAGETVVDLGAGDGRVLVTAKKMYPSVIARGCELVPTIWLFGKLYLFFKRADVRLRLGDAFKEDVRDADVVLLYLMPEMNAELVSKFDRELKPGTRVVSRTFKIAGKEPKEERVIPGKAPLRSSGSYAGQGRSMKLYLYVW